MSVPCRKCSDVRDKCFVRTVGCSGRACEPNCSLAAYLAGASLITGAHASTSGMNECESEIRVHTLKLDRRTGTGCGTHTHTHTHRPLGRPRDRMRVYVHFLRIVRDAMRCDAILVLVFVVLRTNVAHFFVGTERKQIFICGSQRIST